MKLRKSTPKVVAPKIPFTQKGICLKLRMQNGAFDVAMRVIEGFSEHRTSNYAALLSYFGFLSIFPLFAALTAILGFVLQDNEDLRKEIVNSALANVPIIGQQIKANPDSIRGNAFLLVFGIATSLWAGTRAFVGAQNAMNDIWDVPMDERPNLWQSRGRAMVGIMIVGVGQIGAGILAGISATSGVAWVVRILFTVATLLVHSTALAATYRVLTFRRLEPRAVLPGALVGGVALVIIQILTSTIVNRAVQRADAVYGTFSSVIALFGWLSLNATAALAGAELNSALDRRRRKVPFAATAC